MCFLLCRVLLLCLGIRFCWLKKKWRTVVRHLVINQGKLARASAEYSLDGLLIMLWDLGLCLAFLETRQAG
jgi:hypothetical protein